MSNQKVTSIVLVIILIGLFAVGTGIIPLSISQATVLSFSDVKFTTNPAGLEGTKFWSALISIGSGSEALVSYNLSDSLEANGQESQEDLTFSFNLVNQKCSYELNTEQIQPQKKKTVGVPVSFHLGQPKVDLLCSLVNTDGSSGIILSTQCANPESEDDINKNFKYYCKQNGGIPYVKQKSDIMGAGIDNYWYCIKVVDDTSEITNYYSLETPDKLFNAKVTISKEGKEQQILDLSNNNMFDKTNKVYAEVIGGLDSFAKDCKPSSELEIVKTGNNIYIYTKSTYNYLTSLKPYDSSYITGTTAYTYNSLKTDIANYNNNLLKYKIESTNKLCNDKEGQYTQNVQKGTNLDCSKIDFDTLGDKSLLEIDRTNQPYLLPQIRLIISTDYLAIKQLVVKQKIVSVQPIPFIASAGDYKKLFVTLYGEEGEGTVNVNLIDCEGAKLDSSIGVNTQLKAGETKEVALNLKGLKDGEFTCKIKAENSVGYETYKEFKLTVSPECTLKEYGNYVLDLENCILICPKEFECAEGYYRNYETCSCESIGSITDQTCKEAKEKQKLNAHLDEFCQWECDNGYEQLQDGSCKQKEDEFNLELFLQKYGMYLVGGAVILALLYTSKGGKRGTSGIISKETSEKYGVPLLIGGIVIWAFGATIFNTILGGIPFLGEGFKNTASEITNIAIILSGLGIGLLILGKR